MAVDWKLSAPVIFDFFSLALSPLWALTSGFQLHEHFTDGRTPWTGDQLVSRPLPKHRINTYTYQTSMPCVGFEPMILASERAKTVHARLPWQALFELQKESNNPCIDSRAEVLFQVFDRRTNRHFYSPTNTEEGAAGRLQLSNHEWLTCKIRECAYLYTTFCTTIKCEQILKERPKVLLNVSVSNYELFARVSSVTPVAIRCHQTGL
jgi:hypothetical protein